MRAVCFAMVRNEEDIIEAFVRHTLNNVDHLYIADNLSNDGTGDILRALVSEGLPLTVTLDDEQALLQNEKMTNMYRAAFKEDAFDFAFFLDADEFLHLDRELLVSSHTAIGAGHAFYIPRTNYLYRGEPDPKDPLSVFEHMVVTDSKPEDPKSMIFHNDDLCRRFRIGNGNHHVRDWAQEGRIVSRDQDTKFATISHFPIRSIGQYLRKSLLGSLALQLRAHWDGNPKKGIGNHWHRQAQLILEQGAEITPERLQQNLYGKEHREREGDTLRMVPDFDLRYAHLMQETSIVVQLVRMYSRTIDEMWYEREAWDKRLKSVELKADHA